MKKQLQLISLALLTYGTSSAQVTMSKSLPPFGTKFSLNSATGTTRASVGADQTWDYSSVTTTPVASYEIIDIKTVGQTIQDSFPNCQYVEYMNIGAPQPDLNPMDYYKADGDVLLRIGTKGSGSGIERRNDTAMIFNQAYNSSLDYRNITNTYVGYGTLKVKTKTYTNVVMMLQTKTTSTDTTVSFYQFTPHFQRLYAYFVTGGNVAGAYYYEPIASSSGLNNIASNYKSNVYPNPANDVINIENLNAPNGFKYTITDMLGKQWLTDVANNGKHAVDIKSLPKGIYILNMSAENGSETQKLIIE